jgi:phosphatidylinositol alpha-1,6-mannosyltransferase
MYNSMYKNISLLSLETFSATGGIQKMTRTLAHALYQIAQKNKWGFQLSSLYDSDDDLQSKYIPAGAFKGFVKNRLKFIIGTVFPGKKTDVLILSHINLAVVALLTKLVNPKCQVWLIAHGIEVWRPLSFQKRMLLKQCDKIICVSAFTKQQMISRHGVDPDACYILNNIIDPFIKLPDTFNKPDYLLKRYALKADDIVIFSLTRLASSEKYKGHERVIQAISKLKPVMPQLKYILSGKYDDAEEQRVKQLVKHADIAADVTLTGFIDDSELTDHFLLADIFVLPSRKEGFGIVFIEALACGLPVICGNADGSVDAIRNGELGTAINADDPNELERCITEYLAVPLTLSKRKYLQQKCLEYFSEDTYITKLQQLLTA